MVWTTIRIFLPLSNTDVETLHAGDRVLINGIIYTARDAAHKRFIELIEKGQSIPVDLNGAVIYYTGPTGTPPGKVIGSAGPTTSARMDSYTPKLLEHTGLKGMIGKGERSHEVREACKSYRSIYFAATGGVGALLSRHIKSSEIVLYDDLGTEAVRKLEVVDFPVIVINDIYGRDFYELARKKIHHKTGIETGK